MNFKSFCTLTERTLDSQREEIINKFKSICKIVKTNDEYVKLSTEYLNPNVYREYDNKFIINDEAIYVRDVVDIIKTIDPVARTSKNVEFENIIFNWVKNGKKLEEDAPYMNQVLTKFKRVQALNKKLSKKALEYKSPGEMDEELKEILGEVDEQASQYPAEVFYNSDKFKVYRINRFEGEGQICFKDSGWCVQHEEMFKHYKPPYYMVVKKDGPKEKRFCLVHEDSMQIKDVRDDALEKDVALEIKDILIKIFGIETIKKLLTQYHGTDLYKIKDIFNNDILDVDNTLFGLVYAENISDSLIDNKMYQSHLIVNEIFTPLKYIKHAISESNGIDLAIQSGFIKHGGILKYAILDTISTPRYVIENYVNLCQLANIPLLTDIEILLKTHRSSSQIGAVYQKLQTYTEMMVISDETHMYIGSYIKNSKPLSEFIKGNFASSYGISDLIIHIARNGSISAIYSSGYFNDIAEIYKNNPVFSNEINTCIENNKQLSSLYTIENEYNELRSTMAENDNSKTFICYDNFESYIMSIQELESKKKEMESHTEEYVNNSTSFSYKDYPALILAINTCINNKKKMGIS